MAAEFVTAIKTNEIPVGSITAVDIRGTRVAVANVGGTYYAFDDACTHEQCSLAEEGELAGTIVTCTCHGSEFDVQTGKVRGFVTDRGVMARRFVIVGASLAGATAAITLREQGADATVTLIGAEQQLPYERPALSKAYLRGEVPFDKALIRPAAFYAEHRIFPPPGRPPFSLRMSTDVDGFVGEATNLRARERLSPWLK